MPIFGLIVSTAVFAATIETTPLGRRVALDGGAATLFVPHGFSARDGTTIDLLLHLHGASRFVEPAFIDVNWPSAVLVEFTRQGLSSVYTKPFSDPALFPRLLRAALSAAKEVGLAEEPRLGRVVVSSFSAGFGGVRELLKVPESYNRIDGLVMADSIYCGYDGDPSLHKVDAVLMTGFRHFAAESADGKKAFLLTHSALVPDGYASTGEAADHLIGAVGGKPREDKIDWGGGWIQTRSLSKGRFLVLGFAGAAGPDHAAHLREIAKLWKRFREL